VTHAFALGRRDLWGVRLHYFLWIGDGGFLLPFLGLAAVLVVLWLFNGGLEQFENIFLDELGAGESLIGLSSTFAALLELLAMLWADRLAGRYGADRLLRTALALGVVRRGLVLAWPTIPTIFVMRVAGGISFSFYSVAVVVFISEHAKAGQRAAALSLVTVTLFGLIQILGAPLSGLAFDALGAYWLYTIAMSGGFLGWLILWLTAARHGSEIPN
jgi:MFS family permease